jgi:glycosyl transferase, family 25
MLANIISIKDSSRRAAAIQRGNECGIVLRFYDACNYINDSILSHSDEFDIAKFRKRYKRNPASGEIGVFMSHFKLWSDLRLEKKGYHLVLEDDFIPKISADNLKNIILAAKEDYDVIILGYSKVDKNVEKIISITNPIKPKYSFGQYKIGKKFHESTCGALSYVVNDSFFDKVLVENMKPFFLIDDWSVFKKMGVNILHVSPLCFYEDYKEMGSSIEKSGRASIDYSSSENHHILYRFFRNIYRRLIGLTLSLLMLLGIYSSS